MKKLILLIVLLTSCGLVPALSGNNWVNDPTFGAFNPDKKCTQQLVNKYQKDKNHISLNRRICRSMGKVFLNKIRCKGKYTMQLKCK